MTAGSNPAHAQAFWVEHLATPLPVVVIRVHWQMDSFPTNGTWTVLADLVPEGPTPNQWYIQCNWAGKKQRAIALHKDVISILNTLTERYMLVIWLRLQMPAHCVHWEIVVRFTMGGFQPTAVQTNSEQSLDNRLQWSEWNYSLFLIFPKCGWSNREWWCISRIFWWNYMDDHCWSSANRSELWTRIWNVDMMYAVALSASADNNPNVKISLHGLMTKVAWV